MQCGTLNWILEQKNDISGQTSDPQIKSGVNSRYQCWLLSSNKCTLVMRDVNIRGSLVRKISEFCTIFATSPNLKLFLKKVYLNKQKQAMLQPAKIRSI